MSFMNSQGQPRVLRKPQSHIRIIIITQKLGRELVLLTCLQFPIVGCVAEALTKALMENKEGSAPREFNRLCTAHSPPSPSPPSL